MKNSYIRPSFLQSLIDDVEGVLAKCSDHDKNWLGSYLDSLKAEKKQKRGRGKNGNS